MSFASHDILAILKLEMTTVMIHCNCYEPDNIVKRVPGPIQEQIELFVELEVQE